MNAVTDRKINPSLLKKKLFIGITLLVPFIFFLGLELILHWLDYGPDLSLFKNQELHGRDHCVMNPDVKFRYFGSLPYTPSTSIHYFQPSKPPSAYRIFCLGGSTTVGYPYYFNASCAFFLSQRLKTFFPDKNIEVINLGMTATNSYTVLDIAGELTRYQPDLVIVYDGHNEFYGALGVASTQTAGSLRFITLLYLRLVHFRTFQLLSDLIQKFSGLFTHDEANISRGTLMETLSRDQFVTNGSTLYHSAYEVFHENLSGLKEHCRTAGIPLILGTQVSNLRDQPPFVSVNSHMPAQQQELFQQSYKKGMEFQSKGLFDSAIVLFTSAIAADSLYADAHYRLARCFDEQGRKQEALSAYSLARDYDALRFRTDSKFNALIRSMEEDKGCFIADIDAAFKSLSQDSLVGNDLLTDHLHPNSRGYYEMARNYARVMRDKGLLFTRQEWESTDTINEKELWENRFVTDLDERMALQSVKVITSGWPFKNQSATVEYIPSTDTLNYIAQMLATGKLGWMDAHMHAVAFYKGRGDIANVEGEYKTIIAMYPHIVGPYLELASVYFQQHRFAEMQTILLHSLEISPTLKAYYGLGHLMLDKGDYANALTYFEKMENFYQSTDEKIQNGLAMSFAYVKTGQLGKAKILLDQVLTIKPDFQPALQLLNEVNRQLGKER